MRKPKKLINDPMNVAQEQFDGLLSAMNGKLEALPGITAAMRTDFPSDKVAIVTGGGAGHEPLFAGYVGRGLADAAALGDIFAAPAPNVILQTTEAVNNGKGVIYIYGNYAGDNMNFDIAAELADDDDIKTHTIRVWDDVASAPLDKIQERRGTAGDLYVLKIAGAASEQYNDFDKIVAVTERARDNTRSIGVALSAGSIPQTNTFNFELPHDELEIGMGLHGEPGVSREKMTSADEVVDRLIDQLCDDLPYQSGDEVCLLVNNLGASTYMELLIANRRAHVKLTERGIKVHNTLVGNYCTSQEMSGYSITLMKLDDELKTLFDLPCESFALRK
ncbi:MULTISPECIES: dihydroxyacetone kinase subunit DhaK [Vibrio]|jgi:dihydroxyacetone kinase-like protein|uniref:dihydroxyacetone kinase subunit DhaK n=1 Tax=Vibrio TaxID=662 RepID=UPI000BFFE147|nr:MULTISPECIES: dihydroxyacetone kinase subunit DhaK [unclassified Vibrio]PHJ41811.1 dihydroxyacetone kinase [Vibrio sp. PID17_43]RIZ55782.1 dihydroxyacetone kinase [Vibrio sp. PID23_8]